MKNPLLFLCSILVCSVLSCNTPKLAVLARVDGEITPAKNQTDLDNIRLAVYITDYLSKHGKVFEGRDFGKHTLKLLVVDSQGMELIETGTHTSPELKKYLRRLFASNDFKPPLDAKYKLGETVEIKIILEHN